MSPQTEDMLKSSHILMVISDKYERNIPWAYSFAGVPILNHRNFVYFRLGLQIAWSYS